MKKELDLAIVIPLKNEERILFAKIEELAITLDNEVGKNHWNFIPVDNGSSDGTSEIIQKIVGIWPLTQPCFLSMGNIGKAMRTGIRHSNAKFIYIMPIDEHDPEFFIWAWRARKYYDLILGSKRLNPSLNGQTHYRRFLTWGLNSLLSILTEFIGSDTHGCKLLHRETLLEIDKRCVISRGQYDTELTIRAIRCGLRVAEVPVIYQEKRPARDFMLVKILRNIQDLYRLQKALKSEPFDDDVKFHRWSRNDVVSKVLPSKNVMRKNG